MENIREMKYYDRDHPMYPEQFRCYSRMPAGVYVLGRLPDPNKPSVAIVGARKCSSYGKSEAMRFGKELAGHGVQIISGLAYGIDTASQVGALQAGGDTFAVLGTGVDVCYPKANMSVYKEIIEKGGVLSEFEPGSGADAWHFPLRNRIISALADVVLVIEAKKRSGSLITVEYALEQGKSIFAIPGRNVDALSFGCNTLISQGAGIALDPQTILEELTFLGKFDQHKPKRNNTAIDEVESRGTTHLSKEGIKKVKEMQMKGRKELTGHLSEDALVRKVYDSLTEDAQSMEEIREKANIGAVEVTNALMKLSLNNYAWTPFEGYYAYVLA